MGKNVPGATVSAAAFNDNYREFQLVYGTSALNHSIYGCRLAYPPGAKDTSYGKACRGMISAIRPLAGLREFRVALNLATARTAAILLIGARSANIPLDSMGMTGCRLNIGTQGLVPLTATTNTIGTGWITFRLPDSPVLYGDVYFQWFFLAPNANPAGLQATGGLKTVIR